VGALAIFVGLRANRLQRARRSWDAIMLASWRTTRGSGRREVRIYEDLLRFVGTHSALVSDRITLFNVVDPDLPAEPPVDQRMRLRAKFEALASDAVRDAFDEWFKAVSDFFLSSPKTLRNARGRSELEEMRDRGRRCRISAELDRRTCSGRTNDAPRRRTQRD